MSDEGRASPGGDQGAVFEDGLPRLVYPVSSRRSGGLSLGINLFPFGKVCSFDCPYCEVFAEDAAPAPGGGPGRADSGGGPERGGAVSGAGAGAAPARPDAAPVSIGRLEAELADFAQRAWPESFAPEPVRDISFSGNGEPSLSPSLEAALAAADRARRSYPEVLGRAKLVLITNSTGFLDPGVARILERAIDDYGLEIWAKLDAGGEELFRLMSGTALPLERIAEGILSFARRRPLVIQSMLCEVAGRAPSDSDAAELGRLAAGLVARGARIREIQAYTYARPSPGGECAALSDARLSELAAEIAAASGLPVRAFGSRGALGDSGGAGDGGMGGADGSGRVGGAHGAAHAQGAASERHGRGAHGAAHAQGAAHAPGAASERHGRGGAGAAAAHGVASERHGRGGAGR